MQDEVNDRTFSLCVQTTKMTGRVLVAAIRKLLTARSAQKQAEKNGRAQEKGRIAERKKEAAKQPHGKQTLKTLQEQGAELTNIPISDDNIKSFDRVARKYGIDYSLKKDISTDPPKFYVFFKAKDVKVMEQAFREYAGKTLGKNKVKRPSVRKKLTRALHKVNHRQRQKTRQRGRGQER